MDSRFVVVLVLSALVASSLGGPLKSTKDDHTELYSHCLADSSNCIGALTNYPADSAECIRNENCEAMVYFEPGDATYRFGLHAHASWVGIGFSQDKSMGTDGTVLCVPTNPSVPDSTEIKVYKSYNNGHSNVLSTDPSGLSATGGYTNTTGGEQVIHCEFTLDLTVSYSPEITISLDQTPEGYYLILQSGNLKADGTPAVHSTGVISTNKLFQGSLAEK